MNTTDSKKCSTCGNPLEDKLSEQIANYLGLSIWPCLKCEIYAKLIVVSSGGIAIEFPPVLLTIQKKGTSYELSRGFGSISIPDPKPQYCNYDGEKTFSFIKTTSDVMKNLERFDQMTKELILKKTWGM